MYYIIPILKDFRHLSDTARKEGDKLADDIAELRGAVKEEGTKVKTIVDYVIGLFIKRKNIKKTVNVRKAKNSL